MKGSRFSLITMGLFVYQLVIGQMISFDASTAGKLSLKVDGRAINDGDSVKLNVSNQSVIKFDFSGIKIKSALVTVKGVSQDASAAAISFDSSDFNTGAATGNKLKLTKANKTVDMSAPTKISLVDIKTRKVKSLILNPQSGTNKPVTDPNNDNGDITDKDKNKKEDEEPYKPGSVLFDALKLADNYNLSETELIMIVNYYFPKENLDDITKARAILDTMLFFKDNNIKPGKSPTGAEGHSGGNMLSSLSLSSIGGLDVTAFADGLAKFLVKRTKQELSIAFFEKFKKIVNKNEDLRILFPATTSLLNDLGEEIYDYERYIQNLREAFRKDITTIHINLPGIIEPHQQFFEDHRPLRIAIQTGCYIAGELENQTHPGDILANYPLDFLDSTKDITTIGSIKLLQLISSSLRDPDTGEDANYWASVGKLRELVSNKRALKFYFGLLYREAIDKYDGIQFSNTSFAAVLRTMADNYDKTLNIYNAYRGYLLQLGDKVDVLNKMIKESRESDASEDSSKLEKYTKYFKASVDLIEYCTEAVKLPIIRDHVQGLKPSVKKYFEISYEVADMVADIHKKSYSAAINHAVRVYDQVRARPLQKATDSLAAAGADKKDAAAKTDFKKAKEESTNSTSTLASLVKYGSFMATVVTAKTSDEVAAAIETAALPVGSSKVKRQSLFNVSLNAYPGLFIGHESIRGVRSKRVFNTYGVTAPLGVSISRGHSIFFIGTGEDGWNKGQKGWSSSLFLSLIDVGAVAAFRFKDDETEEVPTIRLKDIFSPGAFVSIGIPKSPLSMNFGAQMGPNLRKIDVSGTGSNEFQNSTYIRYSFSLAVDIPIFNFYNRTK